MEDLNYEPVLVRVPVALIAQDWNPLETHVWSFGKPATKRRVANCLKYCRFQGYKDKPDCSTYDHAARVAYLIRNPATDPISLTMHLGGGFEIGDGNHRLAAAIYQNQHSILVEFDGYEEAFEARFKVKLPNSPRP